MEVSLSEIRIDSLLAVSLGERILKIGLYATEKSKESLFGRLRGVHVC